MIEGIYVSTAGALVQDAKHSVTANNVANVSTPGYKKQQLVFETRLAEAQARNRSLPGTLPLTSAGGNWIAESVTDFSQGTLNSTANPLDLAIQGEGFFTVSDGKQKYYTRDGSFTLDSQGRLTTGDGKFLVLDDQGKAIVINGDEVKINKDGMIVTRVGGQEVQSGRLALVTFKELQEKTPGLSKIVRPVGNVNFSYSGKNIVPAAGEVRQGFIEQSTVNIVEEMAAMIAGFRAFEANMQAVRAQDSALQRAVEQVGRATPK
jgi:flagellar basal-body rod protein FlgG